MYLNVQLKPSICTVLHIFCRDTLDIMADRFLYYCKRIEECSTYKENKL